MKVVCSCLICKKEFPVKGLFTHVERTHNGSKKYSSGYNNSYKKISESCKVEKSKKVEKYLINPNLCKWCNIALSFDDRKKQFCSHKCSAKFTNRQRTKNGWKPSFEQRRKTSESLTGKTYVEPKLITLRCICGNDFSYVKIGNKNRKFCSKSCAMKFSPSNIRRKEHARKNRSLLENYRRDCSFKFNLKDFPEEFDFSLVEKYGWYSAKNRGNNLFGVSRDHIVSVKYGFDNNIDPEIISHPANCRLLQHSDNVSKNYKCSMTLEQLMAKIKQWKEKYG